MRTRTLRREGVALALIAFLASASVFSCGGGAGSASSSTPLPAPSITATSQPPLSPAEELATVPSGSVLFLAAGYSDNLYLVDANGGQPRQLLDSAESDSAGGFSPDGKFIAYTSQLRDDGQPEGVYAMSSDGSNPRPVATEGSGDWFISWSSQGKILYTDGGLAAGDYLVVNSDGSDRVRISQNNYCTEGADWSPDGNSLVLCQCNSASQGSLACTLSIIDQQGNSIGTLLRDNTVIPHSPRWSPDGSRILYTQQKQTGGLDSIIVMNADGTNARSIYEPPANATWTEAKWSPDGNQIAVMTATQITVVSLPDGSSRILATAKDVSSFAWSPDSKKIAYVAGDGATFQLYVAGSDGGEPKLLAARAGSNVSWSPDGKQILFASNIARQEGVWWASQDGSARGRLAALSAEFVPPTEPTVEGMIGGCKKGPDEFSCLSPDGKSEAVALTNSNVLRIKDLAGGATRDITTAEVSFWNPSPVWSNDGTKIALSAPGPPSPLYVVDVATGAARPIASGVGSGGLDSTIAWSPDDSYIYYVKGTVCREGCAPGFLYRVHSDGTGEERVVDMRIGLVYGFKP